MRTDKLWAPPQLTLIGASLPQVGHFCSSGIHTLLQTLAIVF